MVCSMFTTTTNSKCNINCFSLLSLHMKRHKTKIKWNYYNHKFFIEVKFGLELAY